MDPAIALQDLGEGFKLEVAARCDALPSAGLVRIMLFHVFARVQESLADDVLHAHARGRIAVGVAVALGVLAQCELDALVCTDQKIIRVASPSAA